MSMKDWWSGTDSGKTKNFVNHISPHRLDWKWTRLSAVRGRHEALHGLWRKEKWDWKRRISGVSSTQFRMSGILLPWRQTKNRLCWCFIICMNGRIILLNANPRRFSSERFGWQAREDVIEFKLPRKLSPNLLTHSSTSSWIFMNLSVNSVPLEATLSFVLFAF